MARPKKRDWKLKTLSMDPNIIGKLQDIAKFENMSDSEMVEFLIQNWEAGINPANKLELLMHERGKIKSQLDRIDLEIEDLTKQMKKFEDWRKTKTTRKGEAIRILSRRILERDFEEAERLSKTWQRLTGIPAPELLLEAKAYVDRSGI